MFVFICIISCALVTVHSSDVVTLVDSNFTDKIADHSAALVKFYAPWCGHCKNLAPEFERAAKALKSTTPPIVLIEVDCSGDGKATCTNFGVKGYPTLKVFRHGQLAFDYIGPKHSEGIIQQMKSSVLPGSTELKTLVESDEFLDNPENSVIGFFEKRKSDFDIAFQKLADSLKDQYHFGHTYSNRIMSRHGYRNEVVIFRSPRLQTPVEQPQLKYEGEMSLYKLRSWVTEHYHGLAGVRTEVNMEQFRRPLVVAYYSLEFTGSRGKETAYWRNRVIMAAKKFAAPGKRKVNFAVSDATEFRRELNDLGLSYSNNSAPVVAARDADEQRFIFQAASLSVEGLEQFVNDMLDAKLPPYVKSLPVPTDNTGPVKIVVGRTFSEIVNDASKDVLVYFHSPWCGECLDVDKTLEELANKLKDDKHVVLASIDATKNDVPRQYIIKSFPSIFFASKNSKNAPKHFEGGSYELEELLEFVAQESSEPLHRFSQKSDSKKKDKIKTKIEEKTEL